MYYTNNYGLRLPQRSQSEKANVDDLNYNAEKIDGLTHGNRTMLAVPWDAETDWMKGNFVVKTDNSTLEADYYECKEDHTTGAWDASKWEHRTIGEVLEILAQNAGGATSLDELDDVEITSPSEGQILRRDANGDWVNTDMPDASVTKTVSGNPVEFTDGADAPLVKCVSAITGSQDLHGYDKPWVGGAGVNKMPPLTNGTYTSNGLTATVTDDSITVTGQYITAQATWVDIPFVSAVTIPSGYYLHVRNSEIHGNTVLDFDSQANILLSEQNRIVSISALTSCTKIRFFCNANATEQFNLTMQLSIEQTNSVTDFAPYSNICPITAYNQSVVSVDGKNIAKYSLEYVSPPNVNLFSISKRFIPGDYSASFDTVTNATSWRWYLQLHDASGNLLNDGSQLETSGNLEFRTNQNGWINSSNGTVKEIHFKVKTECYVGFGLCYGDASATSVVSKFMVNRGTTAQPYEPYTSTTHTTTFPSAIYRGSEDVVKGEVSANKIVWSRNSSTMNNAESYPGWRDSGIRAILGSGLNNLYTNSITSVGSAFGVNTLNTLDILFLQTEDYGLSQSDWIALAIDVQIVIDLPTATIEQVTVSNAPIKSLNGYNHIESSTGEMEIEYITQGEQAIVDLVEANPSETPTEVLSAIKINGVVYSLPSGGGGIESLSRSYSQISIS